ncbi:MAG: DNA repair protein RadA [Oscillospiraceae bacterium]|nr:DNA repair protein RadA [Oscillospiraceae bacterium]
MKRSTVFFCLDCGNEYAKWAGQCPACRAWNTLSEKPVEARVPSGPPRNRDVAEPVKLFDISIADETRIPTGLSELDRVLGGGVVSGSLCLVSGEPGIGKSTLLMQICRELCNRWSVLYISGEESPRQLRLRGERLGVSQLSVLAQTDLDDILASVKRHKPRLLIVDSIQTLCRQGLNSTPGSLAQVRECTMALMRLAKSSGVTVFIIGHVNKEGAVAGPKVLEHMVDCVLYFEGERHLPYRILRASKNRFGSTQEIGVFEMADEGLREVTNPSETLLAGRPIKAPGSCVACVMEGSRPMLSEIQALLAPTAFGVPRRTVSGFDYNRAMLLLAVLEKRAGMYTGNQDAYVNVVGGLRLTETACDLPAMLAIASSFKDAPLPGDMAAFGEVGLTGELRGVPFSAQRLGEMFRLGFLRCVIPAQSTKNIEIPDGLTVFRAKTFKDACSFAFA